MAGFSVISCGLSKRASEIGWGGGNSYGHIDIHAWASGDPDMQELADAAAEAITARIVAFLNESDPSEAEKTYQAALDRKGSPFGKRAWKEPA